VSISMARSSVLSNGKRAVNSKTRFRPQKVAPTKADDRGKKGESKKIPMGR
jgi:hypothetical protein